MQYAQLSGALRLLLAQLRLELDHLQMRIDEADAVINKIAGDNEACRRLVAIPGIGPVTATAVIAAIGNGGAFRKGREFAAWMGLVPREHSHWRQAEAARYQQTWELLLAKIVRARRTCGPATTHEAVFRSECVVGTAHIAHAPQCRRRSVS